MGEIRYVKARRGAPNGGPLPPTSHPTHVKAPEKKLLKLNTSFFELRLPLLCVVIVFSLAGVFKLPVFFLSWTLLVLNLPPQADPSTLKNLDFA